MIRSLTALLVVVAFLTSARANIPVYQAGAGKKADQAGPADARKKIIAEINADGAKAIDALNRSDPAAAIPRQQRMLDNIAKLLNQHDPDRSGSITQNPPPQANNPAKPKPSAGGPNHASPRPTQEKQQPAAVQAPAVNSGKIGASARGVEKRSKLTPNGEWGYRAWRPRQGMEAIPRDGLIRNYEGMLRAYYRNIAERSRQKDAD